MSVNIPIPKLGMNMTCATLIEWKAREGDWIEKGSIVLTIETEKTGWEITAEASGYLHILVEEGSEALVGRVVGLIAESKQELEALQKAPSTEIFTTIAIAEVEEAPPAAVTQVAYGAISEAAGGVGERVRISPVARKMAEEYIIDITKIVGTGPGGRIVQADIEKAIEAKKKMEVPISPLEAYQGRQLKGVIPIKGIRKVIAEHMYRSLSVSAQLTVMGDFDMAEMIKLRESLVKQEKMVHNRITYTEMLVLVIAKALKEHPLLNSSLIDNEIKLWEDINVGVAVGLGEKGDQGLIVPVVKNADKKSLIEISQTVKTLVEKAQAGKLMPDDVTGGTFTLTSIGGRGISFFQTPIINQPESAILGAGPIIQRPVVKNGQILVSPVMTYSLTYDHRIVDGVVAENFLFTLKEFLETPGLLLL
jgi:pyruvate dehydrogenase E2 component (dihydrolipoamide acetyltransferase)